MNPQCAVVFQTPKGRNPLETNMLGEQFSKIMPEVTSSVYIRSPFVLQTPSLPRTVLSERSKHMEYKFFHIMGTTAYLNLKSSLMLYNLLIKPFVSQALVHIIKTVLQNAQLELLQNKSEP
jgi:hypothetical protein